MMMMARGRMERSLLSAELSETSNLHDFSYEIFFVVHRQAEKKEVVEWKIKRMSIESEKSIWNIEEFFKLFNYRSLEN